MTSFEYLCVGVDGQTFYEQLHLSMDCLSSKPDQLASLNGPNERFLAGLHGLYDSNEQFYLVTQSDGARPSVLFYLFYVLQKDQLHFQAFTTYQYNGLKYS